MTERARLSGMSLTPLVSSLVAILMAFVIGGIFLEATGKDALEAYRILIDRGLLSNTGLTETLKKMAPLLIASSGLLVALRAGVWNIGIDGQFMVGALFSAVTGAALVGDVPDPVMWIAAFAAGFIGGVAWALIPALLRVRFGLNEIITTLMMNYVALNVTAWLVKGPAKDPKIVAPQTRQIPLEHRLPKIPGSDVHIGLLVGLVCIILVAILFRSTVPGFMLDVIGRNRRAAVHAGIPVATLMVVALLVSGGFAGMAGANDVFGVQGLFKGNWNPGYGFTAFALVYLARLNSLLIVPFAFFFSFLLVGGDSMARRADVPTYFIELLEGLMLLCFAVAVYLERRWSQRTARAASSDPATTSLAVAGESE
ncbi:MAG: ABC transporter permease [Thermomicrobiales bacterium]|nr:ABC transporter permease [Thermomicrobiales bacterium]